MSLPPCPFPDCPGGVDWQMGYREWQGTCSVNVKHWLLIADEKCNRPRVAIPPKGVEWTRCVREEAR